VKEKDDLKWAEKVQTFGEVITVGFVGDEEAPKLLARRLCFDQNSRWSFENATGCKTSLPFPPVTLACEDSIVGSSLFE
jgi:hypothetical protein